VTEYHVRGKEIIGDIEWVFDDLAASGSLPLAVIHLWTLTMACGDHSMGLKLANSGGDEVEMMSQRGWQSLVGVVQASGKHIDKLSELHINVVTNEMLSPTGDVVDPLKGLLWGPVLVIPQEYPHISTHLIDIQMPAGRLSDVAFEPIFAFPDPVRTQEDEDEIRASLVEALVGEIELMDAEEDFAVALRFNEGLVQHDRWRHTYGQVPVRAPDEVVSQGAGLIGPEAVVLITGGLGRVGLALAEQILKCGARVVVTTRSTLPPRTDWARVKEVGSMSERSRAHVENILAVEERTRGKVDVRCAVNVTDVKCMTDLVDSIRQTYGGLHIVLHLAGLADLKYIPDATPQMLNAELDSKLTGTLVLSDALRHVAELERVVLFSSMAAILGGYGMVAYTAANSYMDSFVHTKRAGKQSKVWCSVNWDDWDFEYGKEQVAAYEKTSAQFSMSADEGWRALMMVLGLQRMRQVLVTTRDMRPRLMQWRHKKSVPLARQAGSSVSTGGGQTAPRRLSDENLVKQVLSVLQTVVMDDSIVADDDLFDVGGDSISAAEMLQTLRATLPEVYQPYLSLQRIMAHPSPQTLAMYLQESTSHLANQEPSDGDAGPEGSNLTMESVLKVVHSVYKTVLFDEDIASDDDFFDAGGDSLTAAEVLQSLRNQLPSTLSKHLTLSGVMKHASPSLLAQHLMPN